MQDSAPSENAGRRPAVPVERVPDVQFIAVRQSGVTSAPVAPPRYVASFYWSKVIWLALAILLMLIVSVAGPHLVERYQYASEKGKQRATFETQVAEFENAREALDGSPLEQISAYYQMVNKRVRPSVVHINTKVNNPTGSTGDEEFEKAHPFFGPHRFEGRGQGTGVIVDSEGFIITNYHVIEEASEISVTLSDNRHVEGRLIGYDEPTDLAVIKIDEDRVVPAEWGDSDKVEVGSLVWAVGSPFGLQHTVTMGILSAKNRAGSAGTVYQDFMQTDAAVNPGNSGGPLVDERGRVIGINTAIVGQTYQGISFAVPSKVARNIYRKIKKNGHVSRGWLGVEMRELSDEQAGQLGLANAVGVLVVDLPELPGLPSPARHAGIEPGDILVSWNGHQLDSTWTLRRHVGETDVGTTATVVVIRNGEELQFEVAVAKRPSQPR